MNKDQFEEIGELSASGKTFLEHTLQCFGHDMSDFDKKQMMDSLITLIRSERLDSVVKGIEYWRKNVI